MEEVLFATTIVDQEQKVTLNLLPLQDLMSILISALSLAIGGSSKA
ncbi:MAG: hypothetical protein ACI9FN_000279 [Saprospiraceae bacterium]|jgi:hypothetical protein